jgi:DNA-binding PadR family transcriptional regulator
MEYLSRQEEMALLVVFRLKEEASLVSIRKYLNKNTEKRWSVSSVYIPLDRLSKKGMLETEIGDPTPKRGGRAKRFYKLTEEGIKALIKVRKAHETIWGGLPDLKSVLDNEY